MIAPLDPAAIIEAVAEKVGYGQGAWDVVPPEELVAAFAAVLAPRAEAEERLIQAALAEADAYGDQVYERYAELCEIAAEVRRLREGSSNG